MSRSERLNHIVALLQDGRIHKAETLADQFGVSQRTIYRDMARLQHSGVPFEGTPGTGYRAAAETTLPALNLTGTELEVFRLGLSVVTEAGDESQKAAALSLLTKLDEALSGGPDIKSPFAPSPKLQQNLALIRRAISTRQRLRVTISARSNTIRPLRLDYFGRIWRCICWNETIETFDAVLVGDITFLAALPSLFIDEPGKTLKDYLTA